MKRLVPLFALAAFTSGCIWLTPNSGLRLGDHSAENAASTGTSAQSIGILTVQQPDFAMIFPDFWKQLGGVDVLLGGGALSRRVAVGVALDAAELESEQLFTVLALPAGSGIVANDLPSLAKFFGDLSLKGLANGVAVAPVATQLGGEKALSYELTGTGASAIDPASGKVTAGEAEHYFGVVAWHHGLGYAILIQTTEAHWQNPGYHGLLTTLPDKFKFGTGDVTLCLAGTPDKGATATAGASVAASPAPKAAVDRAASADAAGTGPAIALCYLKPDAPATGAASPGPVATPSTRPSTR